jgi:molecular chaperone GrpE (heat shock protein)
MLRGSAPGTPEGPDLAALQAALLDKDERIAALQASCRDLEAASSAAAQSARESAALSLAEALAGPLSQLATLRSLAARGTTPQVSDVLRLTESLQRALGEAGVEPVGEAGEEVAYDPSLHRPAGSAAFHEGEIVIIAFIGFRLGQRVVRPALVTRKEQ